MKYIIGRKIDMQQHYADNGTVVPFTLIKAGPCVVTQVKTGAKDGYDAIQFGFGEKKKANKPLQGHIRGLIAKQGNGFATSKEMRLSKPLEGVGRGDSVTVGSFAVGDIVDVTGTSKGRGFAGVVKRHHFHGQKASHGHKDQERMPGSIGAGGVQHVFKGKRMAGRMGGEQVTIKKLTVVSVDPENNIFAVNGSVPGARNGILVITAHTGDMVFNKMNSGEAVKTPARQEEQPESISEQTSSPEEVQSVSDESLVQQEEKSEPVQEIPNEEVPSVAVQASTQEEVNEVLESSDEPK